MENDLGFFKESFTRTQFEMDFINILGGLARYNPIFKSYKMKRPIYVNFLRIF